MRRFILATALMLSVVSVSFFLSLSGTLFPAGVREAAAAGETFTWTDTGGEVGDFGITALAWDGAGLYAGTAGHGVWRYDPTAGTWTDTGGDMEGQTVLSLAWSGSSLYATISGGKAWRYDPTSEVWADISAPGAYLNALAWTGSCLYAGGSGVWRYDPAAGIWTDTGYPKHEPHHTVIFSLAWDGAGLYAGGWIYATTNATGTGVWRYDPATGVWTDIGGAMAWRIIETLAWTGSSLYAGCWEYSKPSFSFKGVWSYDPVSGAWSDTGGGLSGVLVPSLAWDGSGLLAGAEMMAATPAWSAWYYDQASATWTDAGWPKSGTDTGPSALAWDGAGRIYAGTTTGLRATGVNQAPYGDGVWYCEVAFSAPALASVAPDRALQFTVWQDVTLEGEGFRAGARAWLEKDGEKATEAFNLKVASDTRITCTLGLFGLAPGAYDLVVENPDGQRAVLEGGFTVSPICGSGSGTALLPLGVALGLLSAGSLGLRRRRKGVRS